MVAEEFQDSCHEQEEDTDADTLSLCDLPLTTSSSDSSWDQYFSNKDDKNNYSSSFGDEGFFEFFSEDFTTSTYPAADNIVFCGKFIGSKGEEEEKTVNDRESQTHEFMNSDKGGSGNSSSSTTTKLRTTSSRHQVRSSGYKRLSSSTGSFNVSSSQVVNSKWYVFAFGMGRYSMEMKQKDIRERQSRRAPASLFRMFDKGEKVQGHGRRSWKVLWGLLRLLGCKKI